MDTLTIKELYHEIYVLPLPFEGGKEVNGIDLTLLDADIVGLASRAEQITQFSRDDKATLLKCLGDLEVIFPYLTEAEAAYFSKHLLICTEITNGIKA